MAALGSLAVVCFLPACGGNSSMAGNSPTPLASFATQADQVVADLAAGNSRQWKAGFDPPMMKAAQAAPLQKGRAVCQDAMGTYRSHGAPTFARKGQFELAQVPVTWAKGPEAVIITFNPNGTIAGLQACQAAGGIGEPFQLASSRSRLSTQVIAAPAR